MNRSTISGIGALVSGSIEGLTKENVHIIDASGRQLSDNQDADSGIGGSFMDQRKEIERYLGSWLRKMVQCASKASDRDGIANCGLEQGSS